MVECSVTNCSKSVVQEWQHSVQSIKAERQETEQPVCQPIVPRVDRTMRSNNLKDPNLPAISVTGSLAAAMQRSFAATGA